MLAPTQAVKMQFWINIPHQNSFLDMPNYEQFDDESGTLVVGYSDLRYEYIIEPEVAETRETPAEGGLIISRVFYKQVEALAWSEDLDLYANELFLNGEM